MPIAETPDYRSICDASERLKGHSTRTSLMQNQELNRRTGANVFVKPECLQRTGSFKFRGAYNAISQIDKTERKSGVVACSSGNHAQGVAEAAALFGCPATIVMPEDAPRIKIERTRRSGADVVLYDRVSGDRDTIAANVIEERGGTFVHPFENPDVIAGQGTVGLEAALDLKELGITPDRLLVCTGGGGLTAGVSLAMHHHFPNITIHSTEPEGFDDYRRSLLSGKREENERLGGSVCDAIITPSPGEIGFSINRDLLSEGLVFTDQDALKAVKFAFEELKLVVEPGGAAALAALLNAGEKWRGETIVVVISGGNIDTAVLERALNS